MIDTDTVRGFLEERHRRLAREATGFAAAALAPLVPVETDADARARAREILTLLGEGGWCRWAVPAAWGGAAETIDLRACCLVREALAWQSPLADAVFALQCLGSLPVALAGGEEVTGRWLPAVAKGAAMAAFAMTEAEAGTDVAGMKTRARRDGDDYVLDGRKAFISNAGLADFYTVFAVTGASGERGEGDAGRPEITAFVVAGDAPGLEFAGAQVLSEPHPLGEIALTNCRVEASARLGEEGEGFKLGMRTLDRLRATVAAAACGMAARALAEASAHARKREQFGRPLAGFQLIQQKLARMATDLAASRLLVYRAAAAADSGSERLTLRSAMAKAFATEAAGRIVDEAVQILGGRGVLADHPVDRLYRAVRSLRIYEGTTEIQQLVIAREVLRGEGD